MHCFQDNDVFLQTETDVMVLYPLEGGCCTQFCYDDIGKGDHSFQLGFLNKNSSVIHRFGDDEVFLRTGSDVINISLLGGVMNISY